MDFLFRQNREDKRQRKNDETIKGNKNTEALRADTRHKDLFIVNLDKETTPAEIVDFFKKHIKVEILETECWSHKD